jgi:hypothetical protein
MRIVCLRIATLCVVMACSLLILGSSVSAAAPIQVGIAEADITPEVGGSKKVWIAGYGQNRPALGVHDPLMVRAIVFSDGTRRIAMAAVDLVGLQYDAVQAIRKELEGFDYVMVASTHNHEGPDTVGMWGPSPLQTGVDPQYIAMVIQKTAETIRKANENLVAATASYGTASDDTLLRDSREPYVPDGVLRAVQFKRRDNGKNLGLVVNWSCHPEAMGSKNQQITADFPHATVALLKKRYECPVVYFTSDCGGLMAPPRDRVKDADGNPLHEGNFDYCLVYGEDVGRLAIRALDSATPIEMTPLVFAAKPISVPMENRLYQVGHMMGILKRDARVWTGDFEQLGEVVTPKNAKETSAVETEVAYLRMGDLHIAGIPGEIYPELVYGKIQEPVDPGADFPDAPLEKSVVELMPGEKFLLIGLANDEIGYIVPLRQWDEKAPFAYGREKSQYGEENSIGKQAAPILMKALENRVREATAGS